MADSFLFKSRIRAQQLYNDAYVYLSEKYQQASELFTPASPFGQILSVLTNISELIFYYVEAAITELNISRARNAQSVFGLSRLTGHNPSRGVSAFGSMSVSIAPGGSSQISGNTLRISNYTQLRCETNGLTYFFDFGSDEFIAIEKSSLESQQLTIVQGTVQSQTFTGTGFPLQSFSINTADPTDDQRIKVTVNGFDYPIEASLYDLGNNEPGCLVKTGINGGLDIYFGTGNFGAIPPEGSIIQVQYVQTAGLSGNLDSEKNITFTILTEGVDELGNEVNLNDVLSIQLVSKPIFGANNEDPEFTRLIAPYASKSFVLANPSNYIYFLKKFAYFTHIDAYNTKDDQYIDDDNIEYLFLLPDVNRKLTTDLDYFNLPASEFVLSPEEKARVYQLLNESGQQLVTSDVQIVDPIIKKYAINIVLKYVEGFDKQVIAANIRAALSTYFLNIKRKTSVPRSDLIGIIENIQGVDSVNVFFVSQLNEDAIRVGYYYVPVYGFDQLTGQKVIIEEKRVPILPGQDPLIGLDDFGDIKIEQNDLVLIRGGWEDRNSNYYEEIPAENTVSSLNIIFKSMVVKDLYNELERSKFEALIKVQQNKTYSPIIKNSAGAST
jgi:hypothetical protein